MIINQFCIAFGFLKGMPYDEYGDDEPTDTIEELRSYKNDLYKPDVVKHMRKLDVAYACAGTKSRTPPFAEMAICEDGLFHFPIQFIDIYEKQDVGVPPIYELYLTHNFPELSRAGYERALIKALKQKARRYTEREIYDLCHEQVRTIVTTDGHTYTDMMWWYSDIEAEMEGFDEGYVDVGCRFDIPFSEIAEIR